MEVDADGDERHATLSALRADQPGDAAGARADVEHARGPRPPTAHHTPQLTREGAVAAEVCVDAFHLSERPNADRVLDARIVKQLQSVQDAALPSHRFLLRMRAGFRSVLDRRE